MTNSKLFFVRLKVFIFHFLSSFFKYYLLVLALIATIVLFWLPLYWWNPIPSSIEIEPVSFTIDCSKKENNKNFDLTVTSIDKNIKKTYIFELNSTGLRLYRDPLGNETIGFQYRVIANDINTNKLVSFPIHVVPPVRNEFNVHNLMFNDICVGGHGIIEHLCEKFNNGYNFDPTRVAQKGYTNVYWEQAYVDKNFPEFKAMVETFNQKIVNAGKLPHVANPNFDFFEYLSMVFYNSFSLILYAVFLISVIGRNNNRVLKIFKLSKSTKKFDDVAGIEEEKSELIEIVDYLKNPKKYTKTGAKFPHGILLYGPPGTGKTLLAKAVAGEANVPFFAISASSFDEKYVGVGASRVRLLFSLANFFSPSIVFIDEIDGISSRRTSRDHQTINELLTKMDGFESNKGVIVIAASNRINDLDEALLRPGRFDRKIKVDLPNFNERKAILQIHTKNKNLSPKVDLLDIAKQTFGFSGAELENVLNEAAILALRESKKNVKTIINPKHISEAIDRIIIGIAKYKNKYDEDTKKIIAVHEVGHALVGLYVKKSELVNKITIIPHGDAAGYTYVLPQNFNSSIRTKKMLLDDIVISLAGRAAELVFFGKDMISTGANNDLQKATIIASEIVKKYGMSDVGMTQFIFNNDFEKTCSNETTFKIDKEIENIIQMQYKNAIKIIKKNKKEFNLFVKALIKKEILLKDDIYHIHKNKKLP